MSDKTTHVGRSWHGHPLEDACPCPQEPCGLVRVDRAVADCPQHALSAAKTLRQGHPESECPADDGLYETPAEATP